MVTAKPEYQKSFPYVLRLLASVLNNTQPPKPNPDTDWASVFLVSKLHSVAGMVYYALSKLPSELRPEGKLWEEFSACYQEQLIYDTNIRLETQRLIDILYDKGVTVVPIKGYVISNDYPVPALRSMADIDMIYQEQDSQIVSDVFCSEGYTLKSFDREQLIFFKKPFHHYEMHSKLLPPTKVSYNYFSDFWDRVLMDESSHTGYISENDSYIYMLEHLAKHLESGGAGIRLIMDIYVYHRAHKDAFDEDYLTVELNKLKLLEFRRVIESLAYNWFFGDNPDTTTGVADFILCSCTFGTSGNSLMQMAIRSESESGKKFSPLFHLAKRVFPPYKFICQRFAFAKKSPLLYPVFLPAYWFRRLFREKNVSLRNAGYYFEGTDSQRGRYLKTIMKDFGLDSRI